MDSTDWLSLAPLRTRGLDLAWSLDDEALTDANTQELIVFRKELAEVIEGYASAASLPHFAHLIHFMLITRFGRSYGQSEYSEGLAPLWESYREIKPRPRSLGVTAAALLRYLDTPPVPVALEQVVECLRDSARFEMLAEFVPMASEQSSVTPGVVQVEAHLSGALQGLGRERLHALMRHASESASNEAPLSAAENRFDPPRSFSEALDRLFERERLSGAAHYADALAGWVQVPDDSASEDAGEPGGFGGFDQRGDFSLLTPSSFAADEDEFLRRYAEGELTYFKREQMQTEAAGQLIIALDLSARAWGEARLALTGALRVIAQQTERRGESITLLAHALETPCDPMEMSLDDLARALETPSLDATPSPLLATLAQSPALPGSRVLLLTHARNLAPQGNASDETSRHLREIETLGASISALAASDDFHMLRGPIRAGRFVEQQRFRTTLRDTGDDEVARDEPAQRDLSDHWRGDIEALPCAFNVDAECFDSDWTLDPSGEYMMRLDPLGLPTLYHFPSGEIEQAPRAFTEACGPLAQPHTLTGVHGGFIVLGRAGEHHVMAHYECFGVRRVTLYRVAWEMPDGFGKLPSYDANQHAYYFGPLQGDGALRSHSTRDEALPALAGESSFTSFAMRELAPKNEASAGDFIRVSLRDMSCVYVPAPWDSRPSLSVSDPTIVRVIERRAGLDAESADDRAPFADTLYVDSARGECVLKSKLHLDRVITPQDEGRRLLAKGRVTSARLRDNTLAFAISHPERSMIVTADASEQQVRNLRWGRPFNFKLHIASNGCLVWADSPEGAEESAGHSRMIFLDPSSTKTNFRIATAQVEELRIEGGNYWLLIRCTSGHTHFITWEGKTLKALHSADAKPATWFLKGIQGGDSMALERGRDIQLEEAHAFCATSALRSAYELPNRSVVMTDVWGRVWLQSPSTELIGALMIREARIAAWMPDGTTYGPTSMTGKAATRFALNRFAEAIRNAR